MVLCQILLKKPEDGVFKSGQPVTGVLKYKVSNPTKFASIDLSLIGKGECQWTETDSDNNSSTYGNKEDYVMIHKNLLGRTIEDMIREGTYEYPFEFYLPDNIPTSMKNNTCKIEYKIKAKFVKANFFNTKDKFESEITVYGYLEPCSPEPLIFGLQKDLFSFVDKERVNLKAEIDKTFLTPGENIKLTLLLRNDSDVPVTTIKAELIKHFTYVAKSKHKKILKETVKGTKVYSPTIKHKTESKFTCIIPTLPSLYSIQNTKILIGEYKVKVTIKFQFPHTNASVEVPVVIGERKDHVLQLPPYDYEKPSSSKSPE